jgi:hypothetical protein
VYGNVKIIVSIAHMCFINSFIYSFKFKLQPKNCLVYYTCFLMQIHQVNFKDFCFISKIVLKVYKIQYKKLKNGYKKK